MFWTSPELLRDVCPPEGGTHKGDIYSFAVILQEIIYRTPPYEACNESVIVPKGIFLIKYLFTSLYLSSVKSN